MNAVLALGMIAVAGVAATRLPQVIPRHSRSVSLVLASGLPLVLLGLALGPAIGVLDRTVLQALAPVAALGVGWIGAVFGSRFAWRFVSRIPRRVAVLVGIQACGVAVVVALAAWLFTRLVPALHSAWFPTLPAVLTLGAVASVSGPAVVAGVARTLGARRATAHSLGLAAALDTAFGVLAFTLALALYHPHEPAGGASLRWYAWLAAAAGSGALVGAVFLGLARLRPAREDLAPSLLGALLLGAGLGSAARLSPFVVCALAGAVIVNFSPRRRQVLAVLHDWVHPIHAVLLVLAGALLALPTAWLLIAVPVLGTLRIVAKWAGVRYGRLPLRGVELPPRLGLATVAQGGVAVALGISFFMTYGEAAQSAARAVVTTIVLGVVVAQVAAPFLMALALRPPRLTPAGAAVELSVDRHGD